MKKHLYFVSLITTPTPFLLSCMPTRSPEFGHRPCNTISVPIFRAFGLFFAQPERLNWLPPMLTIRIYLQLWPRLSASGEAYAFEFLWAHVEIRPKIHRHTSSTRGILHLFFIYKKGTVWGIIICSHQNNIILVFPITITHHYMHNPNYNKLQ